MSTDDFIATINHVSTMFKVTVYQYMWSSSYYEFYDCTHAWTADC